RARWSPNQPHTGRQARRYSLLLRRRETGNLRCHGRLRGELAQRQVVRKARVTKSCDALAKFDQKVRGGLLLLPQVCVRHVDELRYPYSEQRPVPCRLHDLIGEAVIG